MPYHVEVRRSFHRAWAFNLDPQTLRRTVLEPWQRGILLRLGDREWDPASCALRVLEGEQLHPADLAYGQGWNRAERGGRDVARELLARARPEIGRATIVAEASEDRAATGALLEALGITVVGWPVVRRALIAARIDTAPVDAAVLVLRANASPRWHLDAGLALGALPERVVAVALGEQAPRQLEGLPAIRIDVREAAAIEGLADRLRIAGCPVRPTRAVPR